MKKHIMIFIPIVILITACGAQDISGDKVPSLVLNTLKAQYPLSSDVEWEEHGDLYEAEFDMNDSIEVSARIDQAGKMVMQKQDIPLSELSSAIKTAIQNQYGEYVIDDVEKIQKEGAVYYQIELKGTSKKELNLIFSDDGKEEKNISPLD